MSVTLVGCGGAGAGAYGSEGDKVTETAVPAPSALPLPVTSLATVGVPLQSASPPASTGQLPSPYAGVWGATYDGVDKGSCAPVTIDTAGFISGSCFSSIGNPGSVIQGLVAADGSAMLSFGAATAAIKFASTTSAAGPWSSVSGTGTISLTRLN